ncbi:hypothetical protein C8A00DRAFT_18658 [Chaetomidium leptoderma]|uniref:F-box domain-containing protein n=1 Tax=Chaetomidium leptoderma TaxID=669021 RepID=A0AAN6VGE2_9PEZI|nr:hypothetical protein C8A00DRAFT_18658 [Chaetomidium leptoderma]
MDRLPQEVFDRIIRNLDLKSLPGRLAHYATISRQWQYAVERSLFLTLTIRTHEMPKLEEILTNDRRRGYLELLRYRIDQTTWGSRRLTFPAPGQTEANRCEWDHELKRLWNLLRRYWVRHLRAGHGLLAQPPNQKAPRLMLKLGIFMDPKDKNGTSGSSTPDFATPHATWTPPALPGIQALDVSWAAWEAGRGTLGPARQYHPAWLFDLLPACPSIKWTHWRGFDPYIPASTVGTNFRDRMSAHLAAPGMLRNLQVLHLHFDTPDLDRHGQDVQDCRQPVPDTLNRVLHGLSQQLRRLELTGRFLLSPDLFWPKFDTSASKPPEAPSWPHLEIVLIEARLASPEGLFYVSPEIDPAGGPGTTELLGASDASAFGDLLVRVTRAILQMPALCSLRVCFPEAPIFPSIRGVGGGTLFYHHLGWVFTEKWRRMHRDGRCNGLHDYSLYSPWLWHWHTPCPAEALDNWEKLVRRFCQRATQKAICSD